MPANDPQINSDRSQPPKTLRQRAEELARTSRTDVARMTPDDVQRLVHELQVHQVELEIQNEELRQSQAELAHARDLYADLYEFAPVGYVTLAGSGQIVTANLTAAAMLGVERQRLLGKRFSSFVAGDSQDDWYLHWRSVFAAVRGAPENGGQSLATSATEGASASLAAVKQVCELAMKQANGAPLVVRLESIAAANEHDHQCRTALIDVTAARQAERRVHDSEQRYHRLTDAVTDYIFHVRVENGRAVETAHDANCEAVTGYSPQEFDENSLLWIAMVPPEDRGIVERQVSQILSGQDAPPIEHRICRKDGRICWVLNTVSPQRDQQGRLIGYDGLLRDITKRKAAEEALQRLNQDLEQRVAERTQEIRLLAAAVSHLGEGVMITDDELDWPGPRIRFVNQALCRITGYAEEELIGKTPRELQGKQTDRAVLGNLKNELDAGRSVLVEVTNYRRDGAPYDAELFITPLFDSSGRRTNFVSIHRDITPRKQIEEALRRAHELSESIIDTAPNIILLLDAQGRIMRFNPYMEQLTGWPLSEVQGCDWFDTFLPERDRERIRGVFTTAISGKRTRAHVNPILAKDGRELDIEWSDAPLTSAEGELVGLLCTGQDISQRKRSERALQESEERLRAVLNTAADAIITIDQRGIINSINRAAEKLFGYSQDELVGRNVKVLMPTPYCDEHDEYIARYLRTRQPRIIGVGREVIGRRKDGSTFPVGLAVSEVDHLQMFTGIIRDISAVKELQKQVLEIAAEENRRIGNELHDNIQQQLTGLGLLSQSLAEMLADAQSPQAGLAARLAKGLKEAMHDVHLLSRGLVPVEVDAEGLRSALANLTTRIAEQHGLDCSFRCPGGVELADNFVATHLYRIAQEAVNNAIKHSQADQMKIVLSSADGSLALQVLDNGVGIEEKQCAGDGMGLKIMHYRAGLIGAVLNVSPRAGGGTVVTCTLRS